MSERGPITAAHPRFRKTRRGASAKFSQSLLLVRCAARSSGAVSWPASPRQSPLSDDAPSRSRRSWKNTPGCQIRRFAARLWRRYQLHGAGAAAERRGHTDCARTSRASPAARRNNFITDFIDDRFMRQIIDEGLCNSYIPALWRR